jgi:hypothetical protein
MAIGEQAQRHHDALFPNHLSPLTSPARTVADCFKFRNKIGPDIALEALREYRRARKSLDDLVQAAQEVRVANVIRPYLEALTTGPRSRSKM